MAGEDTDGVTISLDPTEFALVIGDEGGEMAVRVVGGSEISENAEEMPAAAEIILALAMRLLRDPEFHDEVLDWYYEQDDDEDDEG